MGEFLKKHFLSRKLQKVVSLCKNSSPKYLNFLYIVIFCIPIFLITFQNCKFDKDPQNNAPLGTKPSPTGSSRIGSISQINPENGNLIENQTLSVNSNVTFKFFNVDPSSDTYKWTITRGFDSLVTDASTTTDTYKTQFSQLGAHDVFANSYKGTDLKTQASKRFVVGDSCSLDDILEIELSSESASSFKVGESGTGTFVLKDSEDFSSINWKATLPSGTSVTNEANEDTLTVDLSSESAGTLVIEVSAVSSDASKAGCLTYRKREIDVSSNLTPYLNPISFSDGRNEVEVTLENNDIYKYSRPQTTRYLQIEVLNADNCQYQINSGSATVFSCSGELIEIPSSTDTGCVQGIITVSASNVQGGSLSQSYYHYCLEDGDYCYFGPTSARQDDHVCSLEFASQSSEEPQKGVSLDTDPKAQGRSGFDPDPSVTTTTLSCPSGQYTSSSACSTAKPSNSTCSAQGNGCYGWSCNSGYRKDGNSCVVCTTSASCNSSKPANSTCSADSNGCYSWSCSSGYTKSNNLCVRLQGPSCGTSRNTCNPGTANDGAVADTTSTYKWRCSHNGQNINTCFSCKSGYQRSGSSCVRLQGPSCGTSRNTCSPGTANDGAVPDTTSSYKWRCSHNGQNIDSCFSCKSGYQRSGNSCTRIPSPPILPPATQPPTTRPPTTQPPTTRPPTTRPPTTRPPTTRPPTTQPPTTRPPTTRPPTTRPPTTQPPTTRPPTTRPPTTRPPITQPPTTRPPTTRPPTTRPPTTTCPPIPCGNCERREGSGCNARCVSTMSGPTSCDGICQGLVTIGCTRMCAGTWEGPTSCPAGQKMVIRGCVRMCQDMRR